MSEEEATRKMGKPRKNWKDGVKDALKAQGRNMQENARDRTYWYNVNRMITCQGAELRNMK